MAISVAFDIGKSGALANEIALGVVGNNIVNVNTPGYSRQVAEFEERPSARTAAGLLAGTGVTVRAVTQVLDPLLAGRLQASYTTTAERDRTREQLEALSAVMNDLGEPSLGDELSAWFDAADALARGPQGLTERQTLLGASQSLASDFNRRSQALGRLQQDIDDRIVDMAAVANDEIEEIARLNTAIVARESQGGRANELRDQRQVVINELAKMLGIAAVEQDSGAVRIDAVGGVSLVVEGTVVYRIGTQVDATNPATLSGNTLHALGIVNEAGTFIGTGKAFETGEFAGLVAVRDGNVVTASQNLDLLASTFITAVNAIQTDPAAVDLDGNATVAAPIFGGTTAGTMAVALTNLRRIGAALSTQPGDNENALRLADLRTTTQVALGTSFQGFVALEQGRIGEEAALAADATAASTLVTRQIEAERESLSGVNLNEELTNLLRYQRAFQASARIITVVNSTLDELLRLV